MEGLPLAIVATLITLSILYYYTGSMCTKLLLPPSPPALPIIGHIQLLRFRTHVLVQKLSLKYGPVILLRLGRCSTVVVSSAEAAKDVLKAYDTECATRPPFQGIKTLTYNRLDVAFSPYSAYSLEVKKLFALELLGTNRAQEFAIVKESEVDRLIKIVAKSNSSPFNLDDMFFKLMDAIIGTVALGKTYGADHFKGSEFRNLFVDVSKVLGDRSAEDYFPSPTIGRLIDKLTGIAALRKRTFEKLDAFFEKIIDKHSDPARCVQPGQEDLVDVLLRNLGAQLSSIKITKDHIKAIIFDVYVGGIDTTSLTIVWTFTELIRNARVMHKLQYQIRNVVGNNKPRVKAADLVRLPYLKMVFKEVMRLHPAATLLLPRITTAPIKIGMYDVPVDTLINVNVWAIGRDPTIWENPVAFYPERFETTEMDFRGSNFQFIPFGAGKRMCPGYPMGMDTVELALANLLYHFNWELPHGMTVTDVSMDEVGSISFSKKTPLELVPTIYNFNCVLSATD